MKSKNARSIHLKSCLLGLCLCIGWPSAVEGVVSEQDLPAEAESYIRFLEEKIGAPAVIVSTGPRREETLIRGNSELAEQLRSIISA